MACFLDGPLVVVDIFLIPLDYVTFKDMLCISMIFLFGRARKASLSLSISAACTKA